jgi:hypothetical protein
VDGRDEPGHDGKFASHLASAEKRCRSKMHVLLVLQERAVATHRNGQKSGVAHKRQLGLAISLERFSNLLVWRGQFPKPDVDPKDHFVELLAHFERLRIWRSNG